MAKRKYYVIKHIYSDCYFDISDVNPKYKGTKEELDLLLYSYDERTSYPGDLTHEAFVPFVNWADAFSSTNVFEIVENPRPIAELKEQDDEEEKLWKVSKKFYKK